MGLYFLPSIFTFQPFEIHSRGLAGSCSNLGRIRRLQSGCLSPSGLGKGLFLSVLDVRFMSPMLLKSHSSLNQLIVLLKLISSILQEKPSDPDVFRLLGEVKYELKDYEGSAAAYRLSTMVVFSQICGDISMIYVALLDYCSCQICLSTVWTHP